MKRIYSIFRPPIEQKSYADWITKCDQKLSVSSKSLVAFTSSYCLNQSRPKSISHHIYVADINAPYQPYLIAESEHEFTILEWDPSGTKLLVCDVRGNVTIYNSKDYLVNDWKPYFKQAFSSEQFAAASWYHSGIVSTINVANQNLKNPSNHLEYSDKIQQNKFGASVRLFGGKAAEGCLLVSRTGLVCCLTLTADGGVDVAEESLSPLRSKIALADISHSKDGSFIVATSSGSINSTISFHRVQLSPKSITLDEVDSCGDTKRINVVCKHHYSFHPNIMLQILKEHENAFAFESVNHIRFVSQDSPDEVLIEIKGQNVSLIELWELEAKKRTPVHESILKIKSNATESAVTVKTEQNGGDTQTTTATSNTMTKEWIFKGNYITDKDLVTIQVPKFRIFGTNTQLNLILLAYQDNSVCCLRKEDLQPIEEITNLIEGGSTPSSQVGNFGSDSLDARHKLYPNRSASLKSANQKQALGNNNKRQRLNYITDIRLSTNQSVFVAIDALSQLHVVKLPTQLTCQDVTDEEAYLQFLYEYCLVIGNDWWDVMVCTKQESIETICDKFHDAFERQPKHMQRKYFNRQLMIRASLYRCRNNAVSQCKSSDCYTMIMLNSIASTLKSMLRSQDQDSPAEYLSNFLKTQGLQANFFNCSNVMSKINEKELYVETDLIQCLQPLNQWVVDFAIFLVSSLPQRTKSRSLLPGAGLAQNKEALETLRELLIIIRIWGQQNEASLPVVYKLNDQIDVLPSLFRLISICYTTIGNEPEQSLIDECVQFSNSISISQFGFVLPATGIASPLLHCSNGSSTSSDSRLTLEYFHKPTHPELVPLEKVEGSINMNGNRKIDIVRNISLGAYPVTNVRHCTRCNSVSLIKPAFKPTRIWEQRWMTSCVCGGSWAQSNSLSMKRVNQLTAAQLQHQPTNHHPVNHHQIR